MNNAPTNAPTPSHQTRRFRTEGRLEALKVFNQLKALYPDTVEATHMAMAVADGLFDLIKQQVDEVVLGE